MSDDAWGGLICAVFGLALFIVAVAVVVAAALLVLAAAVGIGYLLLYGAAVVVGVWLLVSASGWGLGRGWWAGAFAAACVAVVPILGALSLPGWRTMPAEQALLFPVDLSIHWVNALLAAYFDLSDDVVPSVSVHREVLFPLAALPVGEWAALAVLALGRLTVRARAPQTVVVDGPAGPRGGTLPARAPSKWVRPETGSEPAVGMERLPTPANPNAAGGRPSPRAGGGPDRLPPPPNPRRPGG